MKRIVSLLLITACVLSLASCAIIPAYDGTELVGILYDHGYEITDVDETVEEGVVGYIHGKKAETGDEIYYIYCENYSVTKSLYNYIDIKQKARIAELKYNIERVEYALYDSKDVTAEQKGDYYELYVNLTEELRAAESYKCGRGINIVWYGTKQAVSDVKKG